MINPQLTLIAVATTISALQMHLKNRQLRQENANLKATLIYTARITMYFGDILDRNDVPITEFDEIALMNLSSIQEESP